MSLLAEEVVEEWLNRQGYFTIRGIKLGVHEIDLLAIKKSAEGTTECRHIEVQVSMRPVSYITQVPRELQRTGRSPNSARRSLDELGIGVSEWVEKKYHHPDKVRLRESLWPGDWSYEFVAHVVKSEDELSLIASHGIKVIRFSDVVSSLTSKHALFSSACGGDIVELVHMGITDKRQ